MREKTYVLKTGMAVALLALLAGCGSSTSTSSTPLTGIKKRVLISNKQGGVVQILDGAKDAPSSRTFGIPGANKMVTAAGFTAIAEGTTQVSVLDGAQEKIVAAPLTADVPTDLAISPDGKTVWVAERNAGFVQAVDVGTGVIVASIAIPSAARLVLSPKGTQLLVFTDVAVTTPPQPNANSFWVIDTVSVLTTAAKNATAITSATSLDQPYTAVFNGTDTQAFVLSCGAGCGGTTAMVTKVDFSTPTAPAFPAQVVVPAATTGLVNGSNLFVAGTPSGSATGKLQVVDVNTLALVGGPTDITDGLHELMVLTPNNRLYIASRACTPGPIVNNQLPGCLTIANVAAAPGATGFPTAIPVESSFRQNFDVTGLQPISGRNIVYVIQGGELDIFDTTTDKPSTSVTQLDIVGLAWGVVQIDP